MTFWRTILKLKPKSETRETISHLSSPESLEPRLCLGSMHGADLARWSPASLDNLSQAEEVLLQDRLDDVAATQAADDSETAVDHNNRQAQTNSHQPSSPPTAQQDENMLPNALLEPINSDTESSSSSQLTTTRPVSLDSSSAAEEDAIAGNAGQTVESTAALPSQQQTVANATSGVTQQSGGQSNITSSTSNWDASRLAQYGLRLDEDGNAYGLYESAEAENSGYQAWWAGADEPVVIKYDFRNQGQDLNQITAEQKQLAINSLERWSQATGGKIVFEQDTQASAQHIINIGAGDLHQFGVESEAGGVLGLGGGQVVIDQEGNFVASGIAWLDVAEHWDNVVGNGDPAGTVDFSTVVSHEIGHTLGYGDKAGSNSSDIMYGTYSGERSLTAIDNAVKNGYFYRTLENASQADNQFDMLKMSDPQLTVAEVEALLKKGSEVTASEDAIIAIVDRNGRILGVRVEQAVLNTITDTDKLVFAIDGAVAKARTAALFSNGDPSNGTLAPLTSRTIRFLSQSTVTQREVESNPNVDGARAAIAAASTVRGPGFVAPIGVGAHFPPDIAFTPQVDLFAIEHTNRDSIIAPGADGIKGTGDDIALRTSTLAGPDGVLGTVDDVQAGRFNIDPTFVPAGQELYAPESYGTVQNSGLLPNAQGRGIATLPGGIPLFRDTNGDKIGDTLIGGVGVFFPGADGYATFEQGFVAGVGQTTEARINADKVLESEFIALNVAGGSFLAQTQFGVAGAKSGLGGMNIDLPFGRLDLVGIQLQVVGPTAGTRGLRQLLEFGDTLAPGSNSGADQALTAASAGDDGTHRKGLAAAEGWLVTPHDGVGFTAAEVEQIIENGITAAEEVRAAVRLNAANGDSGERTRMVLAVTDVNGEVLGLYRMKDATTFSIDVAVAKARNVAYYADASALRPVDQVVTPGTAFTNRTFRFLAQPRFPSGIDGTAPAPFSILRDASINPLTAENIGGPAAAGEFTSVLGHDAFFPMTNFRDRDNLENQNGIVFFPGSTPLYKNGKLIGGLGVSGDGVDQDDVVTCYAALGFLPQSEGIQRADQAFVRGIRLPFQKFLRNPFG